MVMHNQECEEDSYMESMTAKKALVAEILSIVLLLFLFLPAAAYGQWIATYGGEYEEQVHSIQQTSDGGYIVAGRTDSFGEGQTDMWVLKLDASGNVSWQKTYGGTSSDFASTIQQTSDGGYIVAGNTYSYSDKEGDIWVLKLDASGNVSWQKTYGGTSSDFARTIQQTSDGGYIVAGETWSFGAGSCDAWVLKLDSAGAITWQKTYGGAGVDQPSSIQQTSDGGYIVAGWTDSFGDIFFDNIWILKLDESGNVSWQKTYRQSGSESERADSIQQTSDGGYIVSGYAIYGDAKILKLDSNGDVQNCSAAGISTPIVWDTYVFPADSSVVPSISAAILSDTNATISDSTTSPNMVCNVSQLHNLTIIKRGSGSGTFTSDPPGVNCTSTCGHLFIAGSVVTITAQPDPGSLFGGWFGNGCSGRGTCMVTMDAEKTVQAFFIISGAPELLNRQGTIGSKITIIGSGFGTKKGKVLIGVTPARIIKWADTSITCKVTKALNAWESHDVTILAQPLKTAPPTILPGAFVSTPPEFIYPIPSSGVSGEELTFAGTFFGTKKGEVYVEYQDKKGTTRKERCRVTRWRMDGTTGASELRFIVPWAPSESYWLMVTNQVGTASSLLFINLGPLPPWEPW
jgi:hypothetical protein